MYLWHSPLQDVANELVLGLQAVHVRRAFKHLPNSAGTSYLKDLVWALGPVAGGQVHGLGLLGELDVVQHYEGGFTLEIVLEII